MTRRAVPGGGNRVVPIINEPEKVVEGELHLICRLIVSNCFHLDRSVAEGGLDEHRYIQLV